MRRDRSADETLSVVPIDHDRSSGYRMAWHRHRRFPVRKGCVASRPGKIAGLAAPGADDRLSLVTTSEFRDPKRLAARPMRLLIARIAPPSTGGPLPDRRCQ